MFKNIVLFTLLCVLPQSLFASIFPEDIYTGDVVEVKNGAKGQVFATGWEVSVAGGTYPSALILLASDVVLKPQIAQGAVYAFGQRVHLSGNYLKPVAVAGQEIVLSTNSALSEGYWLSGRRVTLEGVLPASGKILAQRVVINGRLSMVQGQVLDVQTEELEIGPHAHVEGDILYRGQAAPKIIEGAKVMGTLTQDSYSFADELKAKLERVAFLGKLGSKLMLVVWLFIAGFIVSILMAPKMRASTKRVRQAPLKMMALGLGYAVFTPIIAILLLASVVGMPVGISMMAGYPVLVISGFAVGVLCLGMLFYKKLMRQYPRTRYQLLGAYVLAMPFVIIITQLPYIGVLGWLIPLSAGLGALSWLKWQQMQAGKE